MPNGPQPTMRDATTSAPGARRTLARLSLLNLGALVLAWAGETAIGERHWLTMLLAYAPQHPLALPSIALLAWAAASRRWRLAALNAGGAAFALLALMGATLPIRAGATPEGRHIRVMTLNIHHGMMGVVPIARVVRDAHPDVLCIQEADAHAWAPDATLALHRLLPGWQVVRSGELATFSRFPVVSHRGHSMPGGSDRQILESVLAVNGERVTVFNVHLDTASHPRSLLRSWLGDHRVGIASLRETTGIRLGQAATLLRLIERTPSPILAAGDFNTPPRGVLYRRLTRCLTDSFRSAGVGLGSTFRSDVPVLRIDYVWAGPGVSPIRCFVPRVHASDHRPVVADLVL